MSLYSFRRARIEDIPTIMDIIYRVLPIMHDMGNWQWDEYYPNEEKFREDISNNDLWVCEVLHQADHQHGIQVIQQNADNKFIVGVCAITMDQSPEYADCGWDLSKPAIVPHRLAIHPDHQRKGIARRFFHKIEEIAVEKGINLIRVDTNKDNHTMQRMFTALNYNFSGEISLLGKKEGLRYLCYQKFLLPYSKVISNP